MKAAAAHGALVGAEQDQNARLVRLEREEPEAREEAPPPPELTVAPGEALANFTSYFGTVPAPLALMLKLLPKGADAYYLMRKGSIDSNPLSPKYGELLLIVILAADYSPMTATHVPAARKAGASDEEIAEAIICAIPAGGFRARSLLPDNRRPA